MATQRELIQEIAGAWQASMQSVATMATQSAGGAAGPTRVVEQLVALADEAAISRFRLTAAEDGFDRRA